MHVRTIIISITILAIAALAIGKVALFDRVLNEQIGSGVLPTLDFNDILINGGGAALIGIGIAALTAWATLRIAVRL